MCHSLQRPCSKVLRGLDAHDSGAGSSTPASLSIPKLSLPVDATESLQVALGVARLGRALPEGAGAHGNRTRCNGSQVLPLAPETNFDLVLTHRRRTYLELMRLLAIRSMARFTLEPEERVGLCAVRKDGGLKQRLIVDARRSNLRFRPCPNVQLLSGEDFSKLQVDPDAMPTA